MKEDNDIRTNSLYLLETDSKMVHDHLASRFNNPNKQILCGSCIRHYACMRCHSVFSKLSSVCKNDEHRYCYSCVMQMPDFFRDPRDVATLETHVHGYNATACMTKGGEICYECYAPGDHMIPDSELDVHRAAIAQSAYLLFKASELPVVITDMLCDFLRPVSMDQLNFSKCEMPQEDHACACQFPASPSYSPTSPS